MTQIVQFLLENYVWILVIVIVTLLAIIGSYASKTNFGEGKVEETKEEPKAEPINNLNESISQEKVTNQNLKEEISKDNVNLQNSANEEVKLQEDRPQPTYEDKNAHINEEKSSSTLGSVAPNTEINSNNMFKDIEEKLNNLDSEINSILPKKEVISGDMLEEVEDILSDKEENKIESTKVSFGSDDIVLPKIKNLKSDDGDIWKK